MKIYVYILTAATFILTCSGPQNTEKPKEIITHIESTNKDSVINALYEYAEPYFTTNYADSIVSLKGQPEYVTSTPWGIHVADSIRTIGYNFIEFKFWIRKNANPELEGIYLKDKKITLPGKLTIDKTTRQDILNTLGQPNWESNDSTKTADILDFTYYINIDEYAIGLSLINDTLRQISWQKNPY